MENFCQSEEVIFLLDNESENCIMKVRIRPKADRLYMNYMVHSCRSCYSNTYMVKMKRLSGRIVEVDTKYTFLTSYNIIDPDNPDKIISVQKLFCV